MINGLRTIFAASLVCLFTGLLAGCSRGGSDYVDGVIVFDNAKDYPELDLKLSDVADITYIPLKGLDEGYPVSNRFEYQGNNAYIRGDEIYFVSSANVIYVFDMAGNPVRKLDRRGRGPGEYGTGILNFWADHDRDLVGISAGGGYDMILEYDAGSFEFKNSYPIGPLTSGVLSLNRDYAVVDRRRPHPAEIDPATFFLLSKSDGKTQPLSPKMERPFIYDESFLLLYPGVTYGRGGMFMNNVRCDTVWWIDNKTALITPRMVDRSGYPGKKNIRAMPSFETERYLFFNVIYQRANWVDGQGTIPTNLPWPQDRMFAFDKQKEKIFRIGLNDAVTPDGRDNIVDRKFAWAFDECWLTCWQTTLHDNYGAVMYQPWDLIENMDTLPRNYKRSHRP